MNFKRKGRDRETDVLTGIYQTLRGHDDLEKQETGGKQREGRFLHYTEYDIRKKETDSRNFKLAYPSGEKDRRGDSQIGK